MRATDYCKRPVIVVEFEKLEWSIEKGDHWVHHKIESLNFSEETIKKAILKANKGAMIIFKEPSCLP